MLYVAHAFVPLKLLVQDRLNCRRRFAFVLSVGNVDKFFVETATRSTVHSLGLSSSSVILLEAIALSEVMVRNRADRSIKYNKAMNNILMAID